MAQQDEGPILRPKKPPARPAGATLLVMCDLDCNWKLDGEAKGRIEAGGSAKAKVEIGQHVVVVATQDSLDRIEKELEIKATGQTLVRLELAPLREAREKAARLTRTDPATRLMWTTKDNGKDVNWQEAMDYCRNLQLAGYSDWRLPAIDELEGIYDKSANVPGQWGNGNAINYHVKGNLQLSGWHWSSSQEHLSGEAWQFYFDSGLRDSKQFRYNYGRRALCVRRTGE
jgi:hypothetical protein